MHISFKIIIHLIHKYEMVKSLKFQLLIFVELKHNNLSVFLFI